MKVSAIMTSDPICIDGDASFDDAMAVMEDHDIRHLPVLEGGALLGVLSDRDLLEATGWLPARVREIREGAERAHAGVLREVVPRDAPTVGPDDEVEQAAQIASFRELGCLPVVRDGALLGILTEMDLVKTYFYACFRGELHDELDPLVGAVMSGHARCVDVHGSLGEAAELCASLGVRHLPVTDGATLVGIVSDRDLSKAVGRGRHDDFGIDEVMTRGTVTLRPDVRLSKAAGILVEYKISSLPVVASGDLVGILTITDVLDHVVRALPDIHARAPTT